MPEAPAPYDPTPGSDRRDRVERIVDAYETLMHRVASAHAAEFLEIGVTMSQAKVLYIVQAAPSVRMSDLAARLGVALSTVSGVIDRLVDQGLLSREDDPADRRHVLLHITPAGTTQLERFRELNAGHFRTILARVGDADLGMVERALAALAAAAGPGEPVTPHPSPAPGSSRLTPTTSTTGGSSS